MTHKISNKKREKAGTQTHMKSVIFEMEKELKLLKRADPRELERVKQEKRQKRSDPEELEKEKQQKQQKYFYTTLILLIYHCDHWYHILNTAATLVLVVPVIPDDAARI